MTRFFREQHSVVRPQMLVMYCIVQLFPVRFGHKPNFAEGFLIDYVYESKAHGKQCTVVGFLTRESVVHDFVSSLICSLSYTLFLF